MNEIASRRQLALARRLRQVIATYNQSRDLVTLGAWRPGSNPQLDQAVALWPAVQHYLDQDLSERATFADGLHDLGELLGGAASAEESAG
jgi:flagellum-specific ATP synthase